VVYGSSSFGQQLTLDLSSLANPAGSILQGFFTSNIPSFASVDLNGDSNLDIVISDSVSDTTIVLFGNGGRFLSTVAFGGLLSDIDYIKIVGKTDDDLGWSLDSLGDGNDSASFSCLMNKRFLIFSFYLST